MAVAVAAAARRLLLLLAPLLLRDLELALVVAAVVQALEVVVGPRLARGRVLAVVLDALEWWVVLLFVGVGWGGERVRGERRGVVRERNVRRARASAAAAAGGLEFNAYAPSKSP